MLRALFVLFFIITSSAVFSQEDVATESDSIKVHSPKKAVIFSSIVPGAGQVYNHLAMPKGKKKAFWKVPLIYAGLGATTYFLIQNQQTQKALKADYSNRINGGIPDVRWEQFDDDGVLTLYNQYLTRRDLSILGVGAVYLVQIIDAGIEAHFVDFDVSEDLSLSVRPTVLYNGSAGMTMQLKFH